MHFVEHTSTVQQLVCFELFGPRNPFSPPFRTFAPPTRAANGHSSRLTTFTGSLRVVACVCARVGSATTVYEEAHGVEMFRMLARYGPKDFPASNPEDMAYWEGVGFTAGCVIRAW